MVQEVLRILCGASEYDELPVRHNEDKLNAELAAAVRWKVDPRSLDDPHTKANLLLQVHHRSRTTAGGYTQGQSHRSAGKSVVVTQVIREAGLASCALSFRRPTARS